MPDDHDLILQLEALANSLPDPILVIDYNGRYVNVLGGAERRFYDSPHPLVGCDMQDVLPEEKWRLFLEVVRKAIDAGSLRTCEYQLSSEQVEVTENNGPTGMQWFQGRVYPVKTPPGKTPAAVWLAINISEQKMLEERLNSLARTDDLTGAFNRRHFMELLHREFEIARRHDHDLSLVSIDIDHFKDINDRYGHSQGDAVLQHLVKIISGSLRTGDVLARIGGEEFAVLCPMTNRSGAKILAERACRLVAGTPIATPRGPIRLTVSLGVTALRIREKSILSMLSRVDEALYSAKRNGRNQVCCC